jgi:ABC-type polysaccharide/polyol phosphate export permease
MLLRGTASPLLADDRSIARHLRHNQRSRLMTIVTTSPEAGGEFRSLSSNAWEDLTNGLRRTDLWGRIGWLDVKRRYRRTRIGPFWSSMTLGVYVVSVGLVGSGLWNQNIATYLPYLTSGMLVWTLLSMIIVEACTLFVQGHALFRNVRFEYSVLAYALVWRNFIIFLHNVVVYAAVVLLLNIGILNFATLLAIPGILLVLMNGVWIALLVGLVCLRFRDVQPLVQTAIQIAMLVTPIFWTPASLKGHYQFFFVQLNPIYRLIDVVRTPLMGEVPTLVSYVGAIAITAVGWAVTYYTFRAFRKRIAYWS